MRGFTILELLVVIGIISVVTLFTIGNGFDTNARADVNSEHTTLRELMTHARNNAMNNVNQTAHGVHIDANNFTLFEGAVYDSMSPSNQATARNTTVLATGLTDVVFEPLSGRATPTSGSVVLSKGGYTVSLSVNAEGRLEW